ncbi:MAG: hypothetical protein HKN36_05235 [Hellea sp.]|nr:hypothetical protein [Hellea sp.]
MNLARYFSGTIKALGSSKTWSDDFDLTRAGLQQSFLALLLSLPFYFVCAAAVVKFRNEVLANSPDYDGAPDAYLPIGGFVLLLLLYALMFPLCVYIFTLVFDRQDRFRPWVIVRHWAFFFVALAAAILMGLSLLGVLPFQMALLPVFILYLGTLAIDIRLAQKIGGFEWGAAILAGCLITAMGLMMILIGMTQYI